MLVTLETAVTFACSAQQHQKVTGVAVQIAWFWLTLHNVVVSSLLTYSGSIKLLSRCPADVPYLLFTRYQTSIQRVNLDGSRYHNVFTSGAVRALDFDFR